MRSNAISRGRALLVSLALVLGCGKDPAPPDAGTEPDAGLGTDAGRPGDSGVDGGTDAGTRPDAGPAAPDAGADAGLDADAGMDPNDDPSYPPCGTPYLGDPRAPADFEPTALGPDALSAALVNGASVSLIEPPQGGRVSFIGVRGVINMDPCSIYLAATVRDPRSGKRQLEGRNVTLRRQADGTGASTDADISTFSNVPLCPNQWSGADIFDQDYELEVILYDRRDRYVSKTLTIRPACNLPGEAAVCRCLCKKGYRLGEPCP